jgi:hypothetical protein
MEFFNHSKAGPICPVPTIWLPDHLKAGPKKCPRDGHSNTGSSGFRMYTVFEWTSEYRTSIWMVDFSCPFIGLVQAGLFYRIIGIISRQSFESCYRPFKIRIRWVFRWSLYKSSRVSCSIKFDTKTLLINFQNFLCYFSDLWKLKILYIFLNLRKKRYKI